MEAFSTGVNLLLLLCLVFGGKSTNMEVLCGHLVGKLLLCRMSLVDYFS